MKRRASIIRADGSAEAVEIDLEPDPDIVEIRQAVLRIETAQASRPAPPAPPTPPGLDPQPKKPFSVFGDNE